ncbi:AraC family transcriptional regulator ligand-binding domain-containing protein [Pseudoalteromonas sp. MTN2-4]|uniref:AraC family transcriptional regulator n=1 Tax=Pseudoalteromonas sp. MTN2-4 TaxID=3056555 RepID=UPI0036F30BF4
MKRAKQFTISPTWQVLLKDMQLEPSMVLALAKLPADLFTRPNATLSVEGYFSLWHGIELAAGERSLPLLLAEHLSVEAFDAPLFAAVCSPNLNTALKRLQQYKPLIGPMMMDIKETAKWTELTVSCYGYPSSLPKSVGLLELVFFTQLARLTTRHFIEPLFVQLPELPENLAEYQAYFGCKLTQGPSVQIHFSHEDTNRPFLTANAPMWAFFADELQQKLNELDATATMAERVTAVLLEALPAGHSAIEYVAEKLAMSKRTLQRKLSAEKSNFNDLLQSIRAELASHYLHESKLSLGEIAFLLGYQETNSFIRAFTQWFGQPPGSYRQG